MFLIKKTTILLSMDMVFKDIKIEKTQKGAFSTQIGSLFKLSRVLWH